MGFKAFSFCPLNDFPDFTFVLRVTIKQRKCLIFSFIVLVYERY